jgi:ribulose-phosphate 3-epimerase
MTSTKMKTRSKPIFAPSILSADFSRLGDEIASVENAGADWLHVDVMDGHFVPNLTMGPMIVEAIRPLTQLPLDCHLMVAEPEKWIAPFSQAGANWITVHAEATPHLNRLLKQIRELGCKAGVSLNPSSPLSLIEEVLDLVDLVLIMSVNPGFGGQKFIESSVLKVQRLKEVQKNYPFLIEVDGGINASNIHQLREAGTDVFVAGSSVFGSDDRQKALDQLKKATAGE